MFIDILPNHCRAQLRWVRQWFGSLYFLTPQHQRQPSRTTWLSLVLGVLLVPRRSIIWRQSGQSVALKEL